jgi:hypothetical protein
MAIGGGEACRNTVSARRACRRRVYLDSPRAPRSSELPGMWTGRAAKQHRDSVPGGHDCRRGRPARPRVCRGRQKTSPRRVAGPGGGGARAARLNAYPLPARASQRPTANRRGTRHYFFLCNPCRKQDPAPPRLSGGGRLLPRGRRPGYFPTHKPAAVAQAVNASSLPLGDASPVGSCAINFINP